MLLLESVLKTRMNVWNEKEAQYKDSHVETIKLIKSAQKIVFWVLSGRTIAEILILKYSNTLSEIISVKCIGMEGRCKTVRLASIMLPCDGSAIVIPSALALNDTLLDTLAFIVSAEYRCNVLVSSDIGGF